MYQKILKFVTVLCLASGLIACGDQGKKADKAFEESQSEDANQQAEDDSPSESMDPPTDEAEEEQPAEEAEEEQQPAEEAVATVPGVPTGLTKTPIGNGQVIVEWVAPTDTGGSPLISYTVARTLNSVADGTCVQQTTSCTLTGHSPPPTPGTNTYTYTVFATNSVGDGPPSASITRDCFRGPDYLDEDNIVAPGPTGCNGDF